jgi:hypothetical protein
MDTWTIVDCETPGHATPQNQWSPEGAFWDVTGPDGETATCCEDCTIEREIAGWTSKRIQTEDQRLREAEWSGVGLN